MLNKSDVESYKRVLLALRARLRGDVSGMADAALSQQGRGEVSAMPLHMADVGTDNFEQEFTLSLVANEEETLAQIEAALVRIAEGSYGSCGECGGRIPKMRLNAIPYTAYCVKCASKLEGSR